MQENGPRVVHSDDIPLGGFAGIVEKQMVISPQLIPGALNRKDISHGFGDFVYLSIGHFKANDGAPLHPHENVDIVTVVLNGSIAHAGTLGDGTITVSGKPPSPKLQMLRKTLRERKAMSDFMMH